MCVLVRFLLFMKWLHTGSALLRNQLTLDKYSALVSSILPAASPQLPVPEIDGRADQHHHKYSLLVSNQFLLVQRRLPTLMCMC